MTTLNKAPKIVLAALNGASGNLDATKYTFKNKKAHEWLTKNLGLVTDDNQHVVCGHVVNFDWNIQQWYVDPFANVAPEVAESDAQGGLSAVAEDSPEVVTSNHEPKHTDFATHYNVLRTMKDGKQMSRCQAIRWVALSWGGDRKEFIAQGEVYGIHKGTLGTQWAKAHREGV